MLKTRILMLDATYFLIDKYDYQKMNVVNDNLDIWLVNKDNAKHPIVRLTSLSLTEGLKQQISVIKQGEYVSNLLNVKESILNIHFNENHEVEVSNDHYKQALVAKGYITSFLNKDFKGFNNSFKPIGDDLESESRRRELRIVDLDNKPKKRKKFDFSMIGPTHIILVLNALVFMAATFLSAEYGTSLTAVILGGLYKNLVYGAYEWWRIITAGFLHVDFFHILMNMFVLMQVGLLVERVYGKKQMIMIYMTSIVTSSLLSLVMMDGGTVSLGASGGIFGLMGAVIVYLFASNLVKIPRIRSQIITTLFANLLISLLPGVSFWGHLGGFIGGVLIAVAVSEAKTLKLAKIHAYISTAIIIVGMFAYSLFLDNNVYNVNKKLDKFTVLAYKEIGLENYANSIDNKLGKYYKSIGEDYE